MIRVFAAAFLALSLSAQDAPSIAMLVRDPALDAARVQSVLGATDPLVRATAARVATVRGVTGALPRIREVLATEKNAEAAREQIRALVINGSEEDVAFAATQLARFPSSIDSDFSEAIARRGAPAATELYLKYQPQLRDVRPFVMQSLFGRPAEIHATTLRFIVANDARAVRTLIDGARAAKMPVNAEVIAAALQSSSSEIRAAAMWDLAEGGNVPEVAVREGASVAEAFAGEVLRRMRGSKPVERAEWLAWLETGAGRAGVPSAESVRKQLTEKEREALIDKRFASMAKGPSVEASRQVATPPFRVSTELPAGLAAKLFDKTRCNAAWIGTAAVQLDRAGRVQTADASITETKCAEVAETLLLLSFAEPVGLTSELASPHMLLVKPKGGGCFDEHPAGTTSSEMHRIGGDITVPKVIKREEPEYPLSARQAGIGGVVLAEAIITRSGCVRDVRLLRQTESPALNAAALLALSKWKFTPGALDGQPVDVIFHLTLNFRLR
jgi:protein TonB